MRVFHYDNDGFFSGEGRAEIDPMETRKQKKAVYLIPGGATTTPPPKKVLDQDLTWKFDGESWLEVIDPEAKALSEKIEREAQSAIAEAEIEDQSRIEFEQMLEAQAQKKAQLEARLNAIKARTGADSNQLAEDLKEIVEVLLEKL